MCRRPFRSGHILRQFGTHLRRTIVFDEALKADHLCLNLGLPVGSLETPVEQETLRPVNQLLLANFEDWPSDLYP